jgi:hypothetical protein
MTEQVEGGALDWLQHNVQLNKEAGKNLDIIDTAPCDWNDYIALLESQKNEGSEVKAGEGEKNEGTCGEQEGALRTYAMDTTLALTKWDLIIGSDLVYNGAGVEMLPRVMKALASPETRIFYAHTRKRYEMVDFDFLAELEKNGLEVRELREPGVSSPPESPEAFTHCFPPMRIAIYCITRKN